MVKKICINCKYYEPDPDYDELGLCHRGPPSFTTYKEIDFPGVLEDDWCGEWEQKQSKPTRPKKSRLTMIKKSRITRPKKSSLTTIKKSKKVRK